MNYNKKIGKIMKRMMGMLLSLSMIVGCMYGAGSSVADAAADETGILTITGEALTLNGDAVIDDSGKSCEMSDLKEIKLADGGKLIIDGTNVGNESLVINGQSTSSSIVVSSGATLICDSVNGTIENYGTIEANILDFSSMSGFTVNNEGVIAASSIVLKAGVNSGAGTYKVSDSLECTGYNSEAPPNVICNADTRIKSDGGSIYLKIDDSGLEEDYIVGEVDSTAIGLLGEEVEINYLPLSECDEVIGGGYLSMEGLSNDIYVKDKLKLKPYYGYQAKTYMGDSQFADTIELTKADLCTYIDGVLNTDYGFYIKRKSDGATTDFISIFEAIPVMSSLIDSDNNLKLVFDDKDPEISGLPKVDGENMSISEGDVINADKVELTVTDEYLDKIVTPDGDYTRENGGVVASGGIYKADIVFESTVGETKDLYFIAYDMSGREISLGFKLKAALLTPEASVTVADITVGENITPILTTDSDGKDLVVYEYKKADEGEDAYSTNVPDTAGTYNIRATIPETESYKMAVCEGTFEILRKTPEIAKVTVADTYVGTDYEPTVTTDSDGKESVSLEYKKEGEEDSKYSDVKPTAAGTYVVRATIPETERYNKIICEGTFAITKKTPTAVVVVSDVQYGNEINPILTTDSDGKANAIFEYKKQSAPESEYSNEVPQIAGAYMIRATIPETDTYERVVCEGTFTITDNNSETKVGTAEVMVPDVKYGMEINPILTTDSDGKGNALFEYKKAEEDDSSYSVAVPVMPGTYNVRVTIPATDNYEKLICVSSFKITKLTVTTSKVVISDIYVGMDYEPVLTTDSDGKDKAVFEYKAQGAAEASYSVKKPTKAGTYMVRATIPATDIYEKATCECSYKIMKKKASAEVIISDQIVGVSYKPQIKTDSDGKDKTSYEYKKTGEDDDAYVKTKPTSAGTYVVRAVVPETDNYEKVTCEKEFELQYLKDSKATYIISGKEGKNGYYTSDVYLKAAKGYKISATHDGRYEDKILYDENIKQVYLKRISDGARTAAIKVERLSIDKVLPVISKVLDEEGHIVNVSDGDSVYVDKMTLTISDENLTAVKINGKEYSVDSDSSKLILEAENGTKQFNIFAEDIAGNEYRFVITLNATWMRTNIIPAGAPVPLELGKAYKLEEGSWTVSGDSTVYSGGGQFYVGSSGDYTFTRAGNVE